MQEDLQWEGKSVPTIAEAVKGGDAFDKLKMHIAEMPPADKKLLNQRLHSVWESLEGDEKQIEQSLTNFIGTQGGPAMVVASIILGILSGGIALTTLAPGVAATTIARLVTQSDKNETRAKLKRDADLIGS